MSRPFLLRSLVGLTVAAAVLGASPAAAAPTAPPAGAQGAERASFIVTLRPGADAAATAAEWRGRGAEISHVYSHALSGFAARAGADLAEQLRGDGRVERVERDGPVRASGTQASPTWGLDRIDQRSRPLDSSYTYDHTGAGVTVYVIDTGVRATHVEFAGRVAPGYTAINDGYGTSDCNGHGTHVAGTVAGTTYGAAKAVTVVPVRVLDCTGSGTMSGVIAGVDWVTSQHTAGAPAVANMSLGGGANSSLDTAMRNSITDGVTYTVAAGNENVDACTSSPARVAEALTIAASTSTDARASYSNWGSCIDLFAPGRGVDPLQQSPVAGCGQAQVVVGEPVGPGSAEDADGQVLIDQDHDRAPGAERSGVVVVVTAEQGVSGQVGVKAGLELLDQVPGRHPLEQLPALGRQPGVAGPAPSTALLDQVLIHVHHPSVPAGALTPQSARSPG